MQRALLVSAPKKSTVPLVLRRRSSFAQTSPYAHYNTTNSANVRRHCNDCLFRIRAVYRRQIVPSKCRELDYGRTDVWKVSFHMTFSKLRTFYSYLFLFMQFFVNTYVKRTGKYATSGDKPAVDDAKKAT